MRGYGFFQYAGRKYTDGSANRFIADRTILWLATTTSDSTQGISTRLLMLYILSMIGSTTSASEKALINETAMEDYYVVKTSHRHLKQCYLNTQYVYLPLSLALTVR